MRFINIFKKESPAETERRRSNRSIAYVAAFFSVLFFVLIAYIVEYTYYEAPEDINNTYNPRQDIYAKRVVRGCIFSRDGDILAKTDTDDQGNEKREYPYGPLFAHVVGFSTHGKTGVESSANIRLLTSNKFVTERMVNILEGEKNKGDCVITTLDLDMQKAAYEALGSYRGAIVATDIKSGEILCMVSKPDFDPNYIADNWEAINSDPNSSVLLNRATQGLYPPGSTFKIVTMLEYLKEHGEEIDSYSFDCNGSFSYEDNKISCYHGISHGKVDITASFAKSCNSSFANISTSLTREDFRKTCEDLLFNEDLPLPFTYKKSYVPINKDSDTSELMQVSIGQGKTQITPIHMNMITCAIANEGTLMRPYVIDRIVNADGKQVKKFRVKEYGKLLDEKYCTILRELMTKVVEEGTASRLKDTVGYKAAGKTGSAEYSSNKVMSHAWFTGYAPLEDPQVAVTVIAEEAGSGGEIAVPMARKVFDAWAKEK
ncbi:MAG: penicillin-binding protein 2 [Lachnospiraceae bacterium]|nr:penicillin-binding protein 2 [Lachnospiraceae bacterium]